MTVNSVRISETLTAFLKKWMTPLRRVN